MIEPKGRMLNRDISESEGFASLSPEAAVLFCMIVPHYNSHGKMPGGPGYIKEIICPRVSYLTMENIPELLREISQKTNVKWYEHEGRKWIQSLKFLKEHQRLDKQKMGKDSIPDFESELALFDAAIPLVENLFDTSLKQVVEKSTQKDKYKYKTKDKAKKKNISPSASPPNPDHGLVVEHVMETYLKAKGYKYPFNGRDGAIIKWLLPNYGPDGSCALWDAFLARSWDWQKNGTVTKVVAHTLANLQANIGELLEAGDWKRNLKTPISAALESVLPGGKDI